MTYITTEYEAEAIDIEPEWEMEVGLRISPELRAIFDAIAQATAEITERAARATSRFAEQLDRDILGDKEA